MRRALDIEKIIKLKQIGSHSHKSRSYQSDVQSAAPELPYLNRGISPPEVRLSAFGRAWPKVFCTLSLVTTMQ